MTVKQTETYSWPSEKYRDSAYVIGESSYVVGSSSDDAREFVRLLYGDPIETLVKFSSGATRVQRSDSGSVNLRRSV